MSPARALLALALGLAPGGCVRVLEPAGDAPSRPERPATSELRPGDSGAIPQTKIIDGKTWSLVWSDEFNGASLDASKWTAIETKPEGSEQAYYQPDEVLVEQGWLRLRAERRSSSGYSYTAGAVTTRGKLWTQFGRVEVGFRAAKGQGLHSKLELASAKEWFKEGIGLVEVLGAKPTSLILGAVWDDQGTVRTAAETAEGPDLAQAFHEAAVQWEPGRLAWFLDGKSLPFAPGQAIAAFDSHPLELLFRTALGTPESGLVGSTTSFPQHLDLDYVRLYQRSDLPSLASNGLLNGSFEDAGTVINSYLLPWDMKAGSEQWATWARDTTVFAPDGGKASLRVTLKAITANTYNVQLSYRPLFLKAGQLYAVTFQARAAVGRPIRITLQDDFSPYADVCPAKDFQLTATWQSFTYSCTPARAVWPGALHFNLGSGLTAQLGEVGLDAVTMPLP